MSLTIKNGTSSEKIKKQLNAIAEKENERRIERLKPFFGILKTDIDPVTLQKKWRDEWQ